MSESWSYSSICGMLLFLATSSRPDICFAVSQVCRFTHDPKQSHATAVKRIVRYLKKTQFRVRIKMLFLETKYVVKTPKYVIYNINGAPKMAKICCFQVLLHFYYQIFWPKKAKYVKIWQITFLSYPYVIILSMTITVPRTRIGRLKNGY